MHPVMGEVQGNSIKTEESIYALKVACEAIPMPSMASLYQFLSKHKLQFPPLYYGNGRRAKRMLRHSEILKIRSMLYTTREVYAGRGRPKGSINIINNIIQRCQQG